MMCHVPPSCSVDGLVKGGRKNVFEIYAIINISVLCFVIKTVCVVFD
jgi:hypothetical protein